MRANQTKCNMCSISYTTPHLKVTKKKQKNKNNKISMYCFAIPKKVFSSKKAMIYSHFAVLDFISSHKQLGKESAQICMCPTDSRFTDPSWMSLLTCLWTGSQQSVDLTGELFFFFIQNWSLHGYIYTSQGRGAIVESIIYPWTISNNLSEMFTKYRWHLLVNNMLCWKPRPIYGKYEFTVEKIKVEYELNTLLGCR